MAGVHLWGGLLAGWLMFLVFLFGTAAFFQQEISAWMRPELRSSAVTGAALDAADRLLREEAPDADAWIIRMPPARGGEPLSVAWSPRTRSESPLHEVSLDPATGRPLAMRGTRGGSFLFSFHYNLYYMPWQLARYLVCTSALAALLAIVSGVIVHKRIFRDFFTLRLGKGQRSWLDAHNVAGVVALPFHLMIVYTGLVTLYFMVMPWAIASNFPDSRGFQAAMAPQPAVVQSVTKPSAPALLSLPQLIGRASLAGEGSIGTIIVHRPSGDAVAEIVSNGDRLGAPYRPRFINPRTGELLVVPPAGPAVRTLGVMTDLHTGRFATAGLRWLYFLSGICGCAMIASGLVLWTRKRKEARPNALGVWLVERLNVGVTICALNGIAAYFLSNRILPLNLAHRPETEIGSLFAVWGASLLWSLWRVPARAWRETLSLGAMLFALIPITNAVTTDRGLLRSMVSSDWVFASFDLTMLIIAAVLIFAARTVRWQSSAVAKSRRPPG